MPGSPPGKVTSLAWTSDGYALAAGYEKAWAVWSMAGRLNGWGVNEDLEDAVVVDDDKDEDTFMNGVQAMVSYALIMLTTSVLGTRQHGALRSCGQPGRYEDTIVALTNSTSEAALCHPLRKKCDYKSAFACEFAHCYDAKCRTIHAMPFYSSMIEFWSIVAQISLI